MAEQQQTYHQAALQHLARLRQEEQEQQHSVPKLQQQHLQALAEAGLEAYLQQEQNQRSQQG